MSDRRSMRAVTAFLFLTGCGNYKSDIDTICHAPERSGAAANPALGSAQRLQIEAEWMRKEVHSKQGKLFYEALASAPTPARSDMLRKEASEQGVADCPFVEQLAADAKRSTP